MLAEINAPTSLFMSNVSGTLRETLSSESGRDVTS